MIDTAGIRDTEDIVEKIGVDKARDSVIKADLVLYVVDTSVPLTREDEDIMKLLTGKQVIVLLNKSDLDTEVSEKEFIERGFQNIVAMSAKSLYGLEDLYEKINELFFHGSVSFNDEVYITNMRHKKALSNAKESLELVLTSIDDEMPEDFFSIDLMNAYEELGYIIGESVGEDLVNEIFAEFCMGK